MDGALMLSSVTPNSMSLGTRSGSAAASPHTPTNDLQGELGRMSVLGAHYLQENIGGVRARLLNVLITDQDTAAEMLGILKSEDAPTDLDARPA